MTCNTYKDSMKHTSPHAYLNQQSPNETSFNFNQSTVELFWRQTKLTHCTQWLYQQTTDTLNNIAKSSLFQENQHFISDIPIFKAKDPQSFDEWLAQIDKVASLTNKDPYKLVLAKSQGSFRRAISSFPPSMGWHKIKECFSNYKLLPVHQTWLLQVYGKMFHFARHPL